MFNSYYHILSKTVCSTPSKPSSHTSILYNHPNSTIHLFHHSYLSILLYHHIQNNTHSLQHISLHPKSILSNKSTTSNTQTLQFYTIHNLQFTALPYTTITPKTYRTNTHSFNPIHSHYPQYLNILQTPITNHNTSKKLE